MPAKSSARYSRLEAFGFASPSACLGSDVHMFRYTTLPFPTGLWSLFVYLIDRWPLNEFHFGSVCLGASVVVSISDVKIVAIPLMMSCFPLACLMIPFCVTAAILDYMTVIPIPLSSFPDFR